MRLAASRSRSILDQQAEEKQEDLETDKLSTQALGHHSIAPSTFPPFTLCN